ncbi:MAG TPA: prepilin peptidase [Methylovirgula sp.]
MGYSTFLVVVTLALFPALMIYAAFSDLFTMTISNRISIALVIGFFALALALHMPIRDIGEHLACALCVLVVTFVFFALHWVGGGDAKLASATALWLGFDQLWDYGIYAALLGGALTLCIIGLRHWPLPPMLITQKWLTRLHDQDAGVPYGIALAIAGLMLYPETRIWLAAANF